MAIINKGFWKLSTLHVLINETGLGDFWRTAKIILRKGEFTLPPVFNAAKARLFSSSKTNWCDENFSNNFNLDDSDIYLPVFPCGNN